MRFPVRALATTAVLALCRTSLADDHAPPASTCAATPWLCWSASTGRDDRPVSGVDALAGGGALTAIGALSFASAPICDTSVVKRTQQSSCFAVSFAAGAPFLALGVPLLVFGAVQHAKYEDWARRHPALTGFSVAPTAGGGAVGWGVRF